MLAWRMLLIFHLIKFSFEDIARAIWHLKKLFTTLPPLLPIETRQPWKLDIYIRHPKMVLYLSHMSYSSVRHIVSVIQINWPILRISIGKSLDLLWTVLIDHALQ